MVKNVPPPNAPTGGPLRALIYDSVYDEYKVGTVGGDAACYIMRARTNTAQYRTNVVVCFGACRGT